LRNILIHAYNDILPDIVWETAVTEIPDLIERLEELVAEAGDEP
jgi:uncharacterized protein with HEPN domain